MNAVDTNVLLRYIVVDDHPVQFSKAEAFLKSRTVDDPAFISLIVLVELIWVLQRLYSYSRGQIHSVLVMLLETAELIIEEEQLVATLVSDGAGITDRIADHLIAFSATKAGCLHTITFDRRAAARIAGMELLS